MRPHGGEKAISRPTPAAGQQPDSGAVVAELLARYMEIAGLDVSARETCEGYIRRTILPALGSMELRKLRGPCDPHEPPRGRGH